MTRELVRREIESAVSLIAQNLDDLRLAFEDGGSDATSEDLRKVMIFLRNELDDAERKITELLRTARVSRGPGFSLDDPPPRAISPADSAPVSDPAEPPQIAARRQRMEAIKKMGGRLSNFSPENDPTAERAPVYQSSGSEYVGAGVGFLDDKNENSDIETL